MLLYVAKETGTSGPSRDTCVKGGSSRSQGPGSYVLSPERELIGGLSLLTDGQWFWYSDLAHYVERYHVTLDPRFVQHARSANWCPPRLTEDELIERGDALFGDEEA
ncbi:hypothetical protein ACWEP8_01925 [Streptomyces hydrogenans]